MQIEDTFNAMRGLQSSKTSFLNSVLLGNGPLEIIKYAENNLIMISLVLTIQQKALRELAAIRKLRIQITHKRIDINMISMIKYLTK